MAFSLPAPQTLQWLVLAGTISGWQHACSTLPHMNRACKGGGTCTGQHCTISMHVWICQQQGKRTATRGCTSLLRYAPISQVFLRQCHKCKLHISMAYTRGLQVLLTHALQQRTAPQALHTWTEVLPRDTEQGSSTGCRGDAGIGYSCASRPMRTSLRTASLVRRQTYKAWMAFCSLFQLPLLQPQAAHAVAVMEPGTDGKKSEMGCLGLPTPLGCEVNIGGGGWVGNRRSTLLLVQWRGHQP
jgi:hypothetical protein